MRRRFLSLLSAVVLLSTAWAAPPERTACPDLAPRCVSGEDPCVHPGAARALLLAFGGGSAGVGAVGWLVGGDTLGSGDPYGGLIGVGGVAGLGAGLGALMGLLSPQGETRVSDRPARPTFRLHADPGAPAVFGEAAPFSLGVAVDPTVRFGDLITLQPHAGARFDLGPGTHVDPRPQAAGAFPTAMGYHRVRASVGAELTLHLPYPLPRPAAMKGPDRRLYAGRFEIKFRPRLEVRRRVLRLGASDQQIQEQVSALPLLVGFRWHVSPRQRFTTLVGPRLDWMGLSDPGDDAVVFGNPVTGSFYAEAWYQVDVPMTPRGQTPTAVNGRFNLGYIHSMLDGQTLDVGAIIGFLGPVDLSFDLRVRKRGAPLAIQFTGGVRLTRGGGPYVEIGLVAPDAVVPLEGGGW